MKQTTRRRTLENTLLATRGKWTSILKKWTYQYFLSIITFLELTLFLFQRVQICFLIESQPPSEPPNGSLKKGGGVCDSLRIIGVQETDKYRGTRECQSRLFETLQRLKDQILKFKRISKTIQKTKLYFPIMDLTADEIAAGWDRVGYKEQAFQTEIRTCS